MQSPCSNYTSGEECGLEGDDGEIKGGRVLYGIGTLGGGRLNSWKHLVRDTKPQPC